MIDHLDELKVSPSWTVDETLRRYPESVTILNALGISGEVDR
jgi:hypothetical protein